MLSSLMPQLLGLGDDSPEDHTLTTLLFGALQVVTLTTGAWMTMQFTYSFAIWLLEKFTVTANFESDNDAYAWIQTWAAAQPEYYNFRKVQVVSASKRKDVTGWQHHEILGSAKMYWCRPVDGARMLCRFKGVHTIVTFYDSPPESDGEPRPALMIVRLLTLDRGHLSLLLDEARTMHTAIRARSLERDRPSRPSRSSTDPQVVQENASMV